MSMRFSFGTRQIDDSDEDMGSDSEINVKLSAAGAKSCPSDIGNCRTLDRSSPYWNDIDEAYSIIEGKNYFIPYFALILCLGGHLTSITGFIPFLVKTPDLLCSYNDGKSWSKWDRDEACSNSHSLMYKVDQNSMETVLNWNTLFDLTCSSKLTLGLFGSFIFIGCAIGSITILRFGDIYGRKPVVNITNILSIFVLIGLYFAHNIILVYFLLLLVGALHLTKGTLLYIHYLEFIPNSQMLKYHSLACVIQISFGFVGIVFFMLVTDGLRYMFVVTAISIIHSFWIFAWPESPRFLYSKRKFEEVHKALAFIARINRAQPWHQKFAIESDEHSDVDSDAAPTINMVDAFKDNTYRSNLIIMAINWIVWSLSFHVIGYYIGEFPGSTFVNASIIVLADVLSCSLIKPYVNLIGVKHGFSAAYACVIVIILLYTFTKKNVVIDYFCVFSMRFGINMAFSLSYYGNSEIFDVKLKSRSYAIWMFWAKVFTIASPLMVELMPHPILAIIGLTFVAGILSQFIRKGNSFRDPEGLKDKIQ